MIIPWVGRQMLKRKPGLRGGCLIIQTGENDFIIAGTGVVITFETLNPDKTIAGIANIDEESYINGQWVKGRNLSGDQNHQGCHLRLPAGDYGIQHLTLYQYQ